MKKTIVVVLIVALLLCVGACAKTQASDATSQPDATPEPYISIEEAADGYFGSFYEDANIVPWEDLALKIEAGEEPFILSIRSKEDYDAGHVEGAYNAAWGQELADEVAMLPKDETVYVYCYSGQTAGQAIALMNLLEIDAVSVKSGFNNGISKAEGYENFVETVTNELPDAGEAFNTETLAFVQEYLIEAADNGNFMVSAEDMDSGSLGGFRVLDIRKPEDVEKISVQAEYINQSFGAGLHDAFNMFNKSEKIVVACYSGQTAGQTVAIMRAMGYDNTFSLKGGMDGFADYKYKQAGESFFIDYFDHGINSPWHMLSGAFNEGVEVPVIDLRSAEDYAEGHVLGAVNAPFGQGLADILDSIPKDEAAWIYCYTGQTSAMAAPIIRAVTENMVYSLDGGYNGKSRKQHMSSKYITKEPGDFPGGFFDYQQFMVERAAEFLISAAENGNNMISAEDLQAALEAGDALTVVDIRRVKDYDKAHIDGAISFEYSPSINDKFDELPEGKLVIAGYDGQYTGYVVTVLRMLGYDAVSLKSGMTNGWEAAKLPTVATE